MKPIRLIGPLILSTLFAGCCSFDRKQPICHSPKDNIDIIRTIDIANRQRTLCQDFNAQSQYVAYLGDYYHATGIPPNNLNCTAIFTLSLENSGFCYWQSGSCTACSFQVKYEKNGEPAKIYDITASSSAKVMKSGTHYVKAIGRKEYNAQDYILNIITIMDGAPGTFHHVTQIPATVYEARDLPRVPLQKKHHKRPIKN